MDGGPRYRIVYRRKDMEASKVSAAYSQIVWKTEWWWTKEEVMRAIDRITEACPRWEFWWEVE